MRKLMIAAAAAALAAGAFAENDPQVYEMTLTVKTTACNTKHKSIANPCAEGETIIYRQQVTRKYQGLFWGCECQVIACPDGYFAGVESQDNRYLFWSATKGFQFRLEGDDDAFKWDLLQVVGPKSANVEGAWTLVLKNTDGKEVLNVAGAGYGSAKNVCSVNAQIKSMSGYVTGINDIDNEGAIYGCYYCGDEIDCEAVQFCPACTDGFDSAKTAVFGSWTLKFNSSAANKLAKGNGTTIDKAYKFPKYVNLDYTDDGEGTTEQTAAQKAEAAYKAAKAELEAAEKNFEEVKKTYDDLFDHEALATEQGKTLSKAVDTANETVEKAEKAYDTATNNLATAELSGVLDETDTEIEYPGAKYIENDIAIDEAQKAVDEQQKIVDKAVGGSAISDAKTELKKKQDILTDAKLAQDHLKTAIDESTDTAARKTAFNNLVKEYEAKKADMTAANEELEDAQGALDTWTDGDDKTEGSYAKARKDADKNWDDAEDAVADAKLKVATTQAACNVVGGTCN